jgi:alcohol/geraniol dehydrogenase (NADP+)
MSVVRAWASPGPRQLLTPWQYDPGPLAAEEVEVEVEHCGLCYSDVSVLTNEWRSTRYPCVAGHEVIGRVVALGPQAKGLALGQRVGIGWTASSCMHCRPCLSGEQIRCLGKAATIVGRHGGFAERLRAHWAWTLPLPAGLEPATAGPLLCGGITVFVPLLSYGISPTARVGVVGIGGLGHMALKFAAAWGCEVTAFTSSEDKAAEARALGAHHVVSSRDAKAIRSLGRRFDLLLVTANVPLDWGALMSTVADGGRMHFVGVVMEPIPLMSFDLIGGQRAVSGSPSGSPVEIATMLEFAARHGIVPQVERFPMSRVNEALAHLEAGKARYRVVLDADFD